MMSLLYFCLGAVVGVILTLVALFCLALWADKSNEKTDRRVSELME